MARLGDLMVFITAVGSRIATLLLSWPLLLSLTVLVTNDLYLKAEFPGWLSGKLSDFSGVFLVTYLACGLFRKAKSFVVVGVVMLFVYWKSPASQWLIETINTLIAANIGRVVDYSDLFALAVIPVAWFTVSRTAATKFPLSRRQLLALPVAAVTLAAITGTSVLMPYGEYSIRNSDLSNRVEDSAIIEAVSRVTDRYELECENCGVNPGEAFYFNDDMDFWYEIDEASNGIRFRIRITKMKGFVLPAPDYDLFDSFQRSLKLEMAKLSPNLELVESLAGPPYNY